MVTDYSSNGASAINQPHVALDGIQTLHQTSGPSALRRDNVDDIMTRYSGVADAVEDVKAILCRWSRNGSLQDYDRFVAVWCALEQEGFSDIRLRREPYELPHNLWRFSAKRGADHTTFMSVERALRSACQSLGHKASKDSVAAMICGPRARGVFILPQMSTPRRGTGNRDGLPAETPRQAA